MKVIEKPGKCIQCESSTNIILDSGVYACIDCLNQVGIETKNIRTWLKDNADKEFINKLLELLDILYENNCTHFENIRKTMEAILDSYNFN